MRAPFAIRRILVETEKCHLKFCARGNKLAKGKIQHQELSHYFADDVGPVWRRRLLSVELTFSADAELLGP